MSCIDCRSKSLTRDDVSGNLICASCGTVQGFDNYDAQIFSRDGPTGTYVRVGSAGTGSVLNYKEKKLYESQNLINEVTYRLNLTGDRANQIKKMIEKITEGQFGLGDWFPILIGACGYIVVRMDNKSLPLAEVASILSCDEYELGRMVSRVVEFLNLKLPEFDFVATFERVIRNSSLSGLSELERDKMDRVKKQGVLLLNCSVKWFLTTGRRPMPMVVAVLVFVAELNGIGLSIEDLAKEVHCKVSTCRRRYKELLEALVKVAEALPWGKDVNVKNVVKNAPFVLGYIEMKAMEENKEMNERLDFGEIDLDDLVRECLKKDNDFDKYGDDLEKDALDFEVENRITSVRTRVGDVDKIQLSYECLAMIYTKFSNEIDSGSSLEQNRVANGKKRRQESDEFYACREWWNGKSELSKKLVLQKLLEKEVGLDPMPPSYVKGCRLIKRRRAKIKAARERIDKIMNPPSHDKDDSGEKFCLSESVHTEKRRKRKRVSSYVDWEDFIIETLLLHQVTEEEIETGHYNTLLDLHVFNSGVM